MTLRSERPHVILFTTDQHRGDHLSVAGHPVVETPNLDAFVRQGAYFPNAYTEVPSTTGARRCLPAGQARYRCGLTGYSKTEWDCRDDRGRAVGGSCTTAIASESRAGRRLNRTPIHP